MLSGGKIVTIPEVQSDDLSFYQNAMSRSQGNFTEDRKKSRKMKVEECGHPVGTFYPDTLFRTKNHKKIASLTCKGPSYLI